MTISAFRRYLDGMSSVSNCPIDPQTATLQRVLTLRLLMSYIYMERLVKPEMLTSYIHGPTFGNGETVSFYLLHNVSTLNQCREVSCVTFVCKHFAS